MGITFEMLPNCGPHEHHHPDGHKQLVTSKPGENRITVESKEELRGAADKFRQVSDDPPPPVARGGLVVEERPDGKFDAVNLESGRPVNESGLSLEEARATARRPSGRVVRTRPGSSRAWFNVEDAAGQQINAQALRLAEAEALAAETEEALAVGV